MRRERAMRCWSVRLSSVEAGEQPIRAGEGGSISASAMMKSSEELADSDEEVAMSYSEGIPPWKEQITLRGLVVAGALGAVFCIITHKLSLTVGVIPSLNVAAGLVGFFFIKLWTLVSARLGFVSKPFTRQENTVIQTCIVSCYGVAFSGGGFATYLLGMDSGTFQKLGDYPGNRKEDVRDPSLAWIYPYTFVVSFIGIFALVPLRKTMIIDYNLTYPSGTATALLINSFHSTKEEGQAKKQVTYLGNAFAASLFWSSFKWFFSGIGTRCGFDNFPSMGLKAFENKFYFDFNLTYIGAGMICPHIVNVSVLLGSIISWGILWPIIEAKEGSWYKSGLGKKDFKGLFGYQVFISIALILGDGLYNFAKITHVTTMSIFKQLTIDQDLRHKKRQRRRKATTYDQRRRLALFLKEGVPWWIAASGYLSLALLSTLVVPHIFQQVKWYFVLCAYLIAPILAFCNAYGCGLTDWSLAGTYGKIVLFIFAAWAGQQDGGVIAGLATCGVMMSIVSSASDLMKDFKTGYLTLSSPRSMFISQMIGTLMGCVVAPATFWLFWTAFDVGNDDGQYPAPYATIYRTMAIVGVTGFSSLPDHCLQLCVAFFAFAVLTNLVKDLVPTELSGCIPIPMAMAIPFYIGPYFTIDMFVGTLIMFFWQRQRRQNCEALSPAVASGLICGDGVWSVPAAFLALARIEPPICMAFLPSDSPLLSSLGA